MKTLAKFLLIFLLIFSFILIGRNFELISLWLYPDDTNRNAEFLKIVLSAIGGLAVVFSLFLAYKRAKATDKGIILQSEAINKQSEQLNLSRKSQTDERFKSAIEHLGDDKEPIILGGVTELHQIAKENPKDYADVIFNILISYIRSTASINNEKINKTVLQTIINYLFKSQFTYRDYQTSKASLANCNFHAIDVEGVNFSNIDLRNTILPNLVKVNLSNCNLSGAIFQSPRIIDSNFSNCQLDNTLFYLNTIQNSNFSNVILSNATFLQVQISYCSFIDANLYASSIFMSLLDNISCSNSNWIELKFAGSKFLEIDFSNSNCFGNNEFIACELYNLSLPSYVGEINFAGVTAATSRIGLLSFDEVKNKIGLKTDKHIPQIVNFSSVKFDNCQFGAFTTSQLLKLSTDYTELREFISKKEALFFE